MSRLRPTLALAFALASVAPDPAAGATLRVHPDSAAAGVPGHWATFVEANAAAASGDSIEVSNAGSPYVHDSVITLVDGVVYRGGFGPDFEGPNALVWETELRLALPPDSTDSVIDAGTAGAQTLLAGFTVTGGSASFSGGGIFCGAGTALTIRNCVVRDNYSDNVGGGITIGAGSSARIFNCDLERNVARLRGGAVSVAAGSDGASIEFCRITACSSATAGQPTGGGGGVFTASGILFARNVVRDCFTGFDGGGLLARNADVVAHTNQFFDCVAGNRGGGAFHDGGAGEHRDSSFLRCAVVGGDGDGGGLFFLGGTWLVQECFVRDCTATDRGGGIHWRQPVGARLERTEITGCGALLGGAVGIVGNLFREVLSVEVVSCTIARNAVTAGGGAAAGIHVFPEGNFADAIVNCIVADQIVGSGISCEGVLNQPNVRYSCVWNRNSNPEPAYGRACDDRTGINGNVGSDPRFCDASADPPQLTVDSFSPCLGTGEGGVDMGAHPGVDCATPVSLQPTSWGRIKALHR